MKKINEADRIIYNTYDNIYSIVPEYMNLQSIPDKVLFIKTKLIREYFSRHISKANAVPLNRIASELGFSNKGNSVTFRFLVAKLVEEEKYPIVSCSKGYYLADNVIDIIQNIETETTRIMGIQRRIRALETIQNSFEKK